MFYESVAPSKTKTEILERDITWPQMLEYINTMPCSDATSLYGAIYKALKDDMAYQASVILGSSPLASDLLEWHKDNYPTDQEHETQLRAQRDEEDWMEREFFSMVRPA